MALISAKTILVSLCLCHMTLGLFFLTNPETIADQVLVYVLGEAMGLPSPRGMSSPSPSLALLGIILALMGLSDLVTLSLPEEICLVHHWGTQAPLRLSIFTAVVTYTLLFGAGCVPFTHTGLSLVATRVTFSFAFLEMLTWFWVWVTLREELRDVMLRKARRN